MIVALTGATGFLGGHVLTALLDAKHHVRALTRKPQPERHGVTWIGGALDDHIALAKLCDGVDVAIHVAGVVNGSAEAFDRGNRLGTMAMLKAAQGKRFVHVSSLAAREPDLALYGRSKRAAEDAVVASKLDWRIVRPPAIYGPGDTENLELFRAAKFGVIPLPPRGRLSVIHAADLAQLIVALAKGQGSQTILEADDGIANGWAHRDFAHAIGAAINRNVRTIALPRFLLQWSAALDESLRGTGAKLTRDRAAYFCHPDWTVDPTKRPPADLWTPQIETRRGLFETASWYRAQGWL